MKNQKNQKGNQKENSNSQENAVIKESFKFDDSKMMEKINSLQIDDSIKELSKDNLKKGKGGKKGNLLEGGKYIFNDEEKIDYLSKKEEIENRLKGSISLSKELKKLDKKFGGKIRNKIRSKRDNKISMIIHSFGELKSNPKDDGKIKELKGSIQSFMGFYKERMRDQSSLESILDERSDSSTNLILKEGIKIINLFLKK